MPNNKGLNTKTIKLKAPKEFSLEAKFKFHKFLIISTNVDNKGQFNKKPKYLKNLST